MLSASEVNKLTSEELRSRVSKKFSDAGITNDYVVHEIRKEIDSFIPKSSYQDYKSDDARVHAFIDYYLNVLYDPSKFAPRKVKEELRNVLRLRASILAREDKDTDLYKDSLLLGMETINKILDCWSVSHSSRSELLKNIEDEYAVTKDETIVETFDYNLEDIQSAILGTSI